MADARPARDDGFYSFRYPPPNGRYPEPRIPFRADPIPLVTSLYRRTGHENRTFVRWVPPEVFKTFVDQQELENDLVWAVQLERMRIPAPGIDYVAARLTTTLTSGPHGLPYQGYRMKNAYSPYEGWEVIDLRPEAASPDLAALFGNRLQKVYSNLLAIHATLAANGVWQMDGVQFAANSRTGDVVLLDYGSFDIFDGPLFRERLESGFLKKTAADFRMDELPDDTVHLKIFLRDVGREVAALRQEEISRCPEPQRTLLTVAEQFLAELEEGKADAFFFPLAGSWLASGRSGFFRSFIYQSIDRELAARMTRRGYPTWGDAVRSQIRGMIGEPGPMNWIAEQIAGWVDRYEPLLSDEGVMADSVLAVLLRDYEAEERRMKIVGIRRGEDLVGEGALDRDFFDRIRGRLVRKPFDEQALSFHEVEFTDGNPDTDNSEFRNLELFLFRIQEGFRGRMRLVHETGGEGTKKVRLFIPSIHFVEAALQEFYPERFSHFVYERGEANPDVMQVRQVKGIHTIGLFLKKGLWGDFIGPREFSGAFLTLLDVYHAVDKTIHAAHLYEVSDVLYQALGKLPPHPAVRVARQQLLDLEIADGFTPRDLLLKVWLPVRVYFLAGEDKLLELVKGEMAPEELSHPAVRNELLHLALSFLVSEKFRMEARNKRWAEIDARMEELGYKLEKAPDASLKSYHSLVDAMITELERDERRALTADPLEFLSALRQTLATDLLERGLHSNSDDVAKFVGEIGAESAVGRSVPLNDLLSLVYHPAEPGRTRFKGRPYVELVVSNEAAKFFRTSDEKKEWVRRLATVFRMLEAFLGGYSFAASLPHFCLEGASAIYGDIVRHSDEFKHQLNEGLFSRVPDLTPADFDRLAGPTLRDLKELFKEIDTLNRLISASEHSGENDFAVLAESMHDTKNDLSTIDYWEVFLREALETGDRSNIRETFDLFFRTLTLPHAVSEIASSVYARHLPMALAANVALEVVYQQHDIRAMEFSSRNHAEAFSRILTNLVNNGIIHRHPSKGKRGEVKVSFMRNETTGLLVVEVSDDGYGMSPAELAAYGVSREQGERAVAAGSRGSGKGSASVGRLLTLLKGKIERMVSVPEKGTSIVFSIPLSLFGGPEETRGGGVSGGGGSGGSGVVETVPQVVPEHRADEPSETFAENLRRALVAETQRRGLTHLTTEVALMDEKRLLVLARRTGRWLEILRRLGYGDLAKSLSVASNVSHTDRLLILIVAVSGQRKMVTQLAARCLGVESESGLPTSPIGMPAVVPAAIAPGGIPVLMGR